MFTDIFTTTNRYGIIYADPPWSYQDKKKNRGGAEKHYRTMKLEDLKALPVPKLCADDSILFMWATFPKLEEALELMEAWGFKYRTVGFTWVKRNKRVPSWFWGMGSWTRSNAEVCLIGIKGKPQRIGKGVHSVLDSPLRGHSQKPEEARERILELMGDLPRIELFSREHVDGWSSWGHGVE